MHTNTAPESQPSCADAPDWQEEWLHPSQVLRSQTLQVRNALTPSAIRMYADKMRAGMVPPLVKVAEVTARGETLHYLVDGWHRWQAGSLVRDGELIRVLVAKMSLREAEWQAAAANMDHGVPLKLSERRGVFRAFIRARKHRNRAGQHLSYREIGAKLGLNHNTLRNWMKKDFPATFLAMSKEDPGHAPGGLVERPPGPSVLDGVRQDLERVSSLALSLPPDQRDILARDLAALLAKLPAPPPAPPDEF